MITDKDPEYVLWITISNLEPNFNQMIKEESKFHFSHSASTCKHQIKKEIYLAWLVYV